MYAEFGKRGLVLLAMNLIDGPEKIRQYFRENKFTFTPLRGKDRTISGTYGVSSYPTNFVIGKDGKIAASIVGFDEEGLKKAVQKATAGK